MRAQHEIECPHCSGTGRLSPTTLSYRRIRERFDEKWLPDHHFGCWVWLASLNKNGYGMLMTGSRLNNTKRPRLAHRVGYELYVGPIPVGLVLDHLCRQRYCVNPWHLEPVTPAVNTQRGNAGVLTRMRKLAQTHCPHGHPLSGENLYPRPDGARGCRECLRAAGRRYYKRQLP